MCCSDEAPGNGLDPHRDTRQRHKGINRAVFPLTASSALEPHPGRGRAFDRGRVDTTDAAR